MILKHADAGSASRMQTERWSVVLETPQDNQKNDQEPGQALARGTAGKGEERLWACIIADCRPALRVITYCGSTYRNGMLVLLDSAPNLNGSLPIGWHLSRRRGDSSGFLPRPENLESVPGLIGSLDERSKVWKRVALRRASARACLTPCSSPADPLRVPC